MDLRMSRQVLVFLYNCELIIEYFFNLPKEPIIIIFIKDFFMSKVLYIRQNKFVYVFRILLFEEKYLKFELY